MNLSGNWDLQIDPGVFKTLRKIPRHYAKTILGIIRFLSLDPYSGDVQKMKGEDNVWRRRIGAYRIFYKIKIPEKMILIFKLERRTSKTY